MVFESAGMLYIFISPEGWKLFITSRVAQMTVKITVQAMENDRETVVETQIFFKTLFWNAGVQVSFVEMD